LQSDSVLWAQIWLYTAGAVSTRFVSARPACAQQQPQCLHGCPQRASQHHPPRLLTC
jgi:hypothetical protein